MILYHPQNMEERKQRNLCLKFILTHSLWLIYIVYHSSQVTVLVTFILHGLFVVLICTYGCLSLNHNNQPHDEKTALSTLILKKRTPGGGDYKIKHTFIPDIPNKNTETSSEMGFKALEGQSNHTLIHTHRHSQPLYNACGVLIFFMYICIFKKKREKTMNVLTKPVQSFCLLLCKSFTELIHSYTTTHYNYTLYKWDQSHQILQIIKLSSRHLNDSPSLKHYLHTFNGWFTFIT